MDWIKFPLSDVSYFISDIQDYFKCITKIPEKFVDNPSMPLYINPSHPMHLRKLYQNEISGSNW